MNGRRVIGLCLEIPRTLQGIMDAGRSPHDCEKNTPAQGSNYCMAPRLLDQVIISGQGISKTSSFKG